MKALLCALCGLILVIIGVLGSHFSADDDHHLAERTASYVRSEVVTAETGDWHVVGTDESLRSISMAYYGSPRHWRTLQLVNDVPMFPAQGDTLWVPGQRAEEIDGLIAQNTAATQ